MAVKKPLINPATGLAFEKTANPFVGGSSISEEEARIKQEDFLASRARGAGGSPNIDPPDPVGTDPEIDIPSVSSTAADGVVGGTEELRGAETENKFDANSALKDIFDQQDKVFASFQEQSAEIAQLAEESRKLTAFDLNKIEQAGEAAGLEFDPLIAEARESKRQGLAKATVGAGERGGFMNTQFAGQAALTQTEGGDFVGAGGVLSQVKGKLEANIQKLQVAKIQANTAARAAAEKAIRTGKKEDLAIAQGIFKDAQDLFKIQNDLVTKRVDLIAKQEERAQARTEFKQEQEDRTVEGLAPNMVSVDAEGNIIEPTEDEIIKAAEAAGIDPFILANKINEAIIELEGLEADKREDALKATKTKADIEATKALTEQRRASAAETEALTPLKAQKLRVDTAKKLKSLKDNEEGIFESIDFLLGGGSINKLKSSDAVPVFNELITQFQLLEDEGLSEGDELYDSYAKAIENAIFQMNKQKKSDEDDDLSAPNQ